MKNHRPPRRSSAPDAFRIPSLILIAFALSFATANAQKLEEIKKLIQNNYTDSTNESALMTAAIRGMMQSLDPYSAYLDPEQYRKMQERYHPESSVGIGIGITLSHDTAIVFKVIASSPADRVGMLPGDKILKIANENAIGLSREDVLGKLSDPTFEGKVEITAFRPKGERMMLFTVTPRELTPARQIVWQMLNDTTGYLRFDVFSENIDGDVHAGILALAKQGMHTLVMDLRGNGGGFVSEASAIAKEFIGGNAKLFTLTGRSAKDVIYYANEAAPFEKLPLVLLVDESTASASELLAGALQDLDRAFIIGIQTYGKSLAQLTYPLSTGGALKLTCSRAYLPSGRLLQRQYKGSAYLTERFAPPESIADNYEHSWEAPSVSKRFKPYLTAYGRKVYGGAGLIPDLLIPEAPLSPSTERLFDEKLMCDLAMQYLPLHGAQLKSDYSAANFMADFRAPASMLSDLESLAKEYKVEVDPKELAHDKQRLEHSFAIQLAYQLFGDDAWRMPDPKKDEALSLALARQSQAQTMPELAAK